MELLNVIILFIYACCVQAESSHPYTGSSSLNYARSEARSSAYQYYNRKTAEYLVSSTKIPDVSFDVGESYAGLIPFFFWFFPTVNPAGKDDIVIWFNGGPGCSSLEGFMQENGPFSWQYGTFRPVPNAWSWHKLANVIWVEYPIGTGFSSGKVTAKNNVETAAQFLSFWRNLVDKFGLQNKRIFITGESYAGVHVPYVGAAMLDEEDETYFNVKGALYYDPVMPNADKLALDHAAFPAFFRHWERVFAIPDSNKLVIEQHAKDCGLDEYLEKYLAYPPPKQPWPKVQVDGCDVIADFDEIVGVINPCHNQYHILDTCPVLWDVLGYPSIPYTPPGATIWFNKPEVRQAIHAPKNHPMWNSCQGPVYAGGSDNYDGAQHEKKLRKLIEKTNNVVIGSGLADRVIQPNTTALAIQGMTWNKKQGFQTAPTQNVVIPQLVNDDKNIPNWAGGSIQGSTHTERGLTLTTVNLAGHMVPQYAPSVAFRHLEFVLGRVTSLSDGGKFSVKISTSYKWPF